MNLNKSIDMGCVGTVMLGYAVLFVGLTFVPGGGTLFWLSVFCTAGAALIVWTLLAFVLGVLVSALWHAAVRCTRAFFEKQAATPGRETAAPKQGPSKWAIPVEEFTDPAFQKTAAPKQGVPKTATNAAESVAPARKGPAAPMVDYIRKARYEGRSDKRIKDSLRRQGWGAEEIEGAFARCTGALFPVSAEPDKTAH